MIILTLIEFKLEVKSNHKNKNMDNKEISFNMRLNALRDPLGSKHSP